MIDKRVCNLLIFIINHSEDLFGKRMNVSEFARVLDVPRSSISEVQAYRREPSKTVLRRIIDLYGVNLLDDTYLGLVSNEECRDLFPESEKPYQLIAMLKRVIVSKRLNNALDKYSEVKEEVSGTLTDEDTTRQTIEIKRLMNQNDILQYEISELKKERLLLLNEIEKIKEVNNRYSAMVKENQRITIENKMLQEKIASLGSDLKTLQVEYDRLKS
jgi:regulator of replication initiation timing